MDKRQRREAAIAMIELARQQIAVIAAAWQKDGVNTAPLAEPVLRIQQALAELARLCQEDDPPPAPPPAAPPR